MFILKTILKVIKVLGSETAPASISFAFVLGAFLALNPILSIQFWLVAFVLLLFRVNIASAMFSLFVFKLLSIPCAGFFDRLGNLLLQKASLQHLWTWLYHTPPFFLTGFNNSISLGGMVTAIVLAPVLFILAILLVRFYRDRIEPVVRNSKIAKAIGASKLYKLYIKLTSPIGGGGRQ